MAYALGVDIGGTKIAAGLIDEYGECRARHQLPSIPDNREAMFRQVVTCIEDLLDESQVSVSVLAGIGIGVPGKVDITNGVAVYQNNLQWTNFPIIQRIKDYFQVDKVIIDNDVYMASFAEWKASGGNPKETLVYLTISTGISCCIIHNGHFLRGAGFAGEIGFLPINERGQRLEEVASGPGMEKMAAKYFSNSNENVTNPSVKEILAAYKSHNPDAIRLMNKGLDALAKGIYAITCLLDPDKLILGGGIMNHNPELLNHLKKALEPYLIPDQIDFLNHMQESQYKKDAGWIGAGLRIQQTTVNEGLDNISSWST